MSHSIRAKRDQDDPLLEVAGDIDAGAADTLSAALSTATKGSEPPELVIIELSGANFLDSRSMGVLADWQARIRASGGHLKIAGARPEVIRLFTMIGLEQAFEFVESVEDARKDAT